MFADHLIFKISSNNSRMILYTQENFLKQETNRKRESIESHVAEVFKFVKPSRCVVLVFILNSIYFHISKIIFCSSKTFKLAIDTAQISY